MSRLQGLCGSAMHVAKHSTSPQLVAIKEPSNFTLSAAVQQPDLCEVCLVENRDARHALVPCSHRVCVALVEEKARGCPLCRTPVIMVLRLY